MLERRRPPDQQAMRHLVMELGSWARDSQSAKSWDHDASVLFD